MSSSAYDTIAVMRNIIGDLRRTESENSGLAGELAEVEVRQAAALNQNIGNVPEMAEHAHRLAGFLHQFNVTSGNAAAQLDTLAKMLDKLEKDL